MEKNKFFLHIRQIQDTSYLDYAIYTLSSLFQHIPHSARYNQGKGRLRQNISLKWGIYSDI